MQRQNFSDGGEWESTVGYSRAVKVGNVVYVAGTVATDENGEVVGINSPYTQTRFILERIEKVLEKAGAKLESVVRTRMFVTDISNWAEVGRAHGEFFATIRPVATMVQVSSLISPELLVEIEVEAVLTET